MSLDSLIESRKPFFFPLCYWNLRSNSSITGRSHWFDNYFRLSSTEGLVPTLNPKVPSSVLVGHFVIHGLSLRSVLLRSLNGQEPAISSFLNTASNVSLAKTPFFLSQSNVEFLHDVSMMSCKTKESLFVTYLNLDLTQS